MNMPRFRKSTCFAFILLSPLLLLFTYVCCVSVYIIEWAPCIGNSFLTDSYISCYASDDVDNSADCILTTSSNWSWV